jgi:uncharacterized FlaG/YvyC family protein
VVVTSDALSFDTAEEQDIAADESAGEEDVEIELYEMSDDSAPFADEAAEPAPAAAGMPSSDDIVQLFRRAMREELAAVAHGQGALTLDDVRAVIREELAAQKPQITETSSPMDQGELLTAVRQAVRHEISETIEAVVIKAVDGMTRKVVDAASAPIGPAEMEDLVGRIAGREMAVALQNVPKPDPTASYPTTDELGEALSARVAGPLDELNKTIANLARVDRLGEEIHTWIQSAISELPSSDEIQRLLSGAQTGSAAIPGDLRALLREELTALASDKFEAVAWEVVPALAEKGMRSEAAAPAAIDAESLRNVIRDELATLQHSPAAGNGGGLDLDALRGLIHDELAGLVGHQIEAVVWEVVPDLAEQIIKKELDRLTT